MSIRPILAPRLSAPKTRSVMQYWRIVNGFVPTLARHKRGSRCRLLLILAAALVGTSCGRHPVAPVIAPRSNVEMRYTSDDWLTQSLEAQSARDKSVPGRAVVDDSPAWSPDGRLVAFHRRFPSSYGPPGLYVVPRHGGAPRFLLPGGFFFPREVSFSPDGQRLVCNDGNQLAFVDLGTGAVSRPLYTDNGAAYPDWSPDGRSVVYARLFLRRFPPEPVDSAGLHLLDVATGFDRPLRYGETVLPSGPVRWIRSGMSLAVIHGNSAGDQFLSIATADGREFFPLVSVPLPKLLWNLQHLEPARPRSGPLATESLVLLVIGKTLERTLQVTIDPFSVSDRRLLGLWDALSPTGKEVAAILPDPSDSLAVVYVGQADAPPQAKMLQLTRYDPP